jgi:superfamily II DNA or RNA helicase
VTYKHLLVLSKDDLERLGVDLYELDNHVFPDWLQKVGRGTARLQEDGGVEFYRFSDPYAVLHEFLTAIGISVSEVIDVRTFAILAKTSGSSRKLNAESERKEELKEQSTTVYNLLSEFLATFLPQQKRLRRIQSDLWTIWTNILPTDSYQGILQWPTGTGKTIGLLILILLTFLHRKQQGRIYRCLLIAPKNDIFDTIIVHLRKLKQWGLHIVEGYGGRLSKTDIPTDKSVLVLATHAALVTDGTMDKLPPMDHVHYDEVHHIVGEELFKVLKMKLEEWNTSFLTGTSATPKTGNPTQMKRLTELFGDPLSIIHRCDVDEAVKEGWIAKPRFIPAVILKNSRNAVVQSYVEWIATCIAKRKELGLWHTGKCIAYLPSIVDCQVATNYARQINPDWIVYAAVEGTEANGDDAFITDKVDGSVRIMFACERFREGSDIHGLEMTLVLMGASIAAYILLQIAGRALRQDYDGKEGWCCIMKPCEEGTTPEDVFDSIMLDIMELLSKGAEGRKLTRNQIKELIATYTGTATVNDKIVDVEETTSRIQAIYMREAYERAAPKEKYHIVRGINVELGLKSREEYTARCAEHAKYIDKPKDYFKAHWTCWYDFLGLDTSVYPPTKADWARLCKEKGLTNWSTYKATHDATMPENPSELYEEFTNWDKEIGVEEEIVW